MNLLILSMTFLLIDIHVPTVTVSGDIVTVDADFAFVEAAPLEVLQGVQLIDATLLASNDGVSPVAWRLSPGTHQITAFGFPDDREFPSRNKVVLTVVVEGPTRQQQIRDAIQRFSVASIEAQRARIELRGLDPTREEIDAALAGPSETGGTN